MTYDEAKDGRHKADTEDFWQEIERRLNAIKQEMQGVVIFSQFEKDRINLFKQLPADQKKAAQIEFLHSHELSLIFIENLSHNNRMFLVLAACTLGLSVPEEYIENFKDYGLETGTSKEIKIVEKAIHEKSTNFDFINAWSAINEAYGYITALTGGDSGNFHYLDKRYLNGTAGNIIQQHIYAYWMHGRWDAVSRIKDQRGDLHEELAEEIYQYTKKNPQSPYIEQLENMIDAKKKPKELKGRITTMKAKRIKQLVRNALIDINDLPDLSYP